MKLTKEKIAEIKIFIGKKKIAYLDVELLLNLNPAF